MVRFAIVLALAACGGAKTEPAPAAKPPPRGPSAAELEAQRVQEERAKHDEVVAAHRKIEEQQQDALAASCDDKAKHERCTPGCYTAETGDPRAGKKIAGPVEIQHLVCQKDGAFVVMDALDGTLQVKPLHGRPAKPHKKNAWQAEIESASSLVVTGSWRELPHPLTKERLRCVTASSYASALRKPLDACGGTGDVVCEAGGNAAAHGLNVIRFRLAEARQLQAANKSAGCQQAALEAVAVARGMPRWRQYAKLNVDQWPKNARFRTRYDGTLDEDTLFATAASLGNEAETVFAACGGPPGAPTTAEQEQSFHTCW